MTPKVPVGSKFGHWQILSTANRRALCRCKCGEIREVAVAALEDGSSISCGCAPLSNKQRRAIHNEKKLRRAERNLSSWGPGR